jgi:phage tail tape-measure protein
MFRALIVGAVMIVITAPLPVSANEKGAAAGAVTGAVAGAVIGGPIGAVVGAVVGGVAVGAATAESTDATGQVEAPVAVTDPRAVPGSGPAHRTLPQPEATGSIVETTCVRDAQGTAKCSRQVVR